MTTGQIVIFIVLGVLFIFALYGAHDNRSKTRFMSLFILGMVTGFFALIAIVETMENNKNQDKLKNKCPEYEKIENVYRLKE